MTNKARILFVDDEKRVLNAMRGLFRREYELFLTTEGAEAVDLVAQNDIDVIVADQRMPGMTGVEVLGQVKQQSPRTVRILLTGYADPSAVEGSINIGEVFRFLSKPCPPKTLKDTLKLAVEASNTQPIDAASAEQTVPARAETPAPKPESPAPPSPTTEAASEAKSEPEPDAAPEPVEAPAPPSTELPSPGTATPEPSQVTAEAANDPTSPAPETVSKVPRIPAHLEHIDPDQTEPALQTLDEAAIASKSDESSSHWQSVTNVIMSADTVEETQENVVLTPETSGIKDIGVVVFTVDSEFAADCIKCLSSDRSTTLATTLVKVAQAIEQQNAGILVTDFTANTETLQKMINALKRYLPELVTIVISQAHDTTDMISLINHGQIFRYLVKPIEPDSLRQDINAAAIRHLYLLNNPDSLKRHEVEEGPPAEDSSTINSFVGRVRQIGQSRSDY